VLKVSLAARQCQRLRSTKVSIRSRSSACSRLVSSERPHRNLTVRRMAAMAATDAVDGSSTGTWAPWTWALL